MGEFPAGLFRMPGDPGSIRSSAGRWSAFGTAATQAGGQILALDTTTFVGPEGDQFRDGLTDSMPEHLRITGDAFGRVAGALNGFAATLAGLQDQMRPLATRAPGLWDAVQRARAGLAQAHADDRAHAREVAARPPDQTPTPDTYRSRAGTASSTLSAAERAWQDCVTAATALRTSMDTAVADCTRAVEQAKDMRFTENPKWWDLGGQFTNFVRDNKDLLQQLSSALKVVSLVAGILSFIPFLAPIMAPLAIGTALAASAIDLSLYAATGQGSLQTILIDVGLNLLPGVGKLARMGMAGRRTAVQVSTRVCKTDPVDIATGEMVLTQTDVELDGLLPLVLSRTHVSSYRVGRWFGESWASTLDQRLEVDGARIYYAAEDAMLLVYAAPEDGTAALPQEGPRWPLARTGETGFTVSDPDRGRTLHFAPAGGTRAGVLPLRAISDRNGHRIDLDYDTGGGLTEVRHSGGYRIEVQTTAGLVTALRLLRPATDGGDVTLVRYGYDDTRWLTEVTNSSGQALRFDYDPDGRITGWRDRNNISYRYTYDEQGRCVATTGSDGFMDGTLVYDPDRQLTVYTDSLGHTTTFHLNETGQVVREVDPLGAVTMSEWNRHDQLLGRVDPLGRTTRCGYDQAGNLIAVTRPDGSQTVAEYNTLGLPVTVTDPDGALWRRGYDQRGNLITVIDPLGATATYSYDQRGHLATVTDALGHVRRIETDAAGLVTAVTNPLGATTRYTRDGFGQVSAVTDPVGGVTRFGWTTEGKLSWRTLPDGATERWSHDGEGNLVEHLDALGQVTRTEIGPFDLPIARVGPDGARLEFSYDTELRLVAVTNPQGLVWRYDSDPTGNLIRETDFNHRELRYVYDAAGQLIARTNGAGQTTRYTRDPLGNVTEQRCGDTITTFAYDPAGRMVAATNADAELAFDRDPLGRVLAETRNGRTLTSGYDLLGRRTHRRTPSGADSVWEYDAGDHPIALHTAGRTIQFDYDPAGQETQRHLDAGAVLAQTWDANHRLASQTLTAGELEPVRPTNAREARLVQRRSYGYRPDGYVTAIEDHLSGARRFELDPTGQVTAVQGPGWTERYAYDPAGNITHAAWPTPNQAHDPDGDARGDREYSGTLIRRAGTIRYQHDAQGRITLRQQKRLTAKPRTWHYTWDADDRLTAVTTPDGQHWRYRYDPLGRRIAKQRLAADGDSAVEQVDFTWDSTVLAEQTRTTGPDDPGRATTWDWEPGTFHPVSQTDRTPPRETSQDWVDEQFYAIITDMVGTPTEMIYPGGNLVWRRRTTLWGTTTENPDGVTCPLRFPGQYHDPETGLNYNYHRYYDPTTARYGTNDPLGLEPGPNPYTYVPNPLRWLDPLGLKSCVVDDVIAETRAATGNITSRYSLNSDQALGAGSRWVGEGYRELGRTGSGVFRSADGTRQFRIDSGSLAGGHAPNVPHVHLETYPPGARYPSTNNHIPLVE